MIDINAFDLGRCLQEILDKNEERHEHKLVDKGMWWIAYQDQFKKAGYSIKQDPANKNLIIERSV